MALQDLFCAPNIASNEIAVFFNRYDYRCLYAVVCVMLTYSNDTYRLEERPGEDRGKTLAFFGGRQE